MDAGAPNCYEDRLRNFQTEAKTLKNQEGSSGDDGYETSNSGDRHPPTSTPPPLNPPSNNTPPLPVNMSATSEQTDTDSNNKSDKPDADESMEPDAESRTAGGSLSNSPKVDPPEDSRSDVSAEASNSQSSMRSTQPQYDPSDTLNQGLMPPQEDSSSQSHEQTYDVRSNPYSHQEQLPPHFLHAQRDQLTFGGVKREYEGMQHMYPQYRREDYYPKYGPGPYKNEMQYGGYNRENEGYDNVHRQFDMYNQVKREQDEMSFNGVKRECDDPYSFVEEEAMMGMLGAQQGPGHMMMGHGMENAAMQQHLIMGAPKKRGRKKKKDEIGMEMKQEPGMDGVMVPIKPVKERKKHDRFNGMSEEEVASRTLPDHLVENLDIIIIGINPGLFAAYKGHHYAGPGNHFWKCLYLSGLTREQMSADEDYKLLNFGIGFTNMVQRATKGSADLTRREIKEGSAVLLEKLQNYRPKIAVFNGKLIYEVFSGKKDFCFGKQPDPVAGTETFMWVMPSSSARCAQLPRAADKVPFYAALKKFRDFLNGSVHHIEESELVFPDTTGRRPQEEVEIRRAESAGESSNPQPHYTQLVPRTQLRLTMEPDPSETLILEDGTEVPLKKKRGRPKKVKLENGEMVQPPPRPPRAPKQTLPLDLNGDQPKKKRGRPKKIRPEDQQFLLQQQQQNPQMIGQPLPPMPGMQPVTNQNIDSQFNIPQNPEFQNQSIDEQMESNNMMYQQQNPMQQSQPQNLQMGGQNSPYFPQQQNNSSMNQTNNPSLDSSGQMDLSQHGPNASVMSSMQRPPSYSQSPGPYSQSPLPQGGIGYSQSPRPQGYSQSPQRHQTPSYTNSPVPRPTGTPQPTNPIQSPYPPSPAQPNSNQQSNTTPFSQTSPQRPQSQNHNYSSPVRNPYSRSPIPQNNTPNYSQQQQSPMYAHSPAGSAPGYSQLSPASQIGNYSSQSPAPNRFSQSPVPLPYSRSPAPQNIARPYERSPAPSAPFPQRSPAIASYSQHNSPVQNAPQSFSPHQRTFDPPMQSQERSSAGPNPFAQSPASNQNRDYPTDLSSEISAAISSPGPVSPGMGHIDFEPPIATNKIRVPESEENDMAQENSPSNSNVGGEQSSDNTTMRLQTESRMQRPLHSHSALDLIGTPASAPSDLSVQSAYESSLESGFKHEQRVGFQVPPASYSQPSPKPEERNPYSYEQTGSALSAGSPRHTDSTTSVMSPHHASMQQHPSMYPFNRMTPSVLGSQGSPFSPAFRSPVDSAPPSGSSASPSEYGSQSKSKSQDVASKSLSGLESLVDQIPSIAEGAEPGPTLPDYALYPPYPHYQASYQPNTTYPGLVGYSAPYVMRPTPGYLPEALGYHAGYAGQYGAGYNLQQAAAGNYPYYNGHYPPQPPPNPYLSTHVLEHIHKNADSSVSFGGYC